MRLVYRLYFQIVLVSILTIGFFSCSSIKYVPDGEYLLNEISIESDVSKYKSSELRPYVRQLPNQKMFNLYKMSFKMYNLSGRDSSLWINRFLKKIGEAPVILDTTLVDKTKHELTKLFYNAGYLNADIESEISYMNKKANVTYKIRGNTPYTISKYTSNYNDTIIEKDLVTNFKPIRGELSSLQKSYINENSLFDSNVLDSERNRITSLLRNRGYYKFNKESIHYTADTTIGYNKVKLNLILDPLKKKGEAEDSKNISHQKYYYNNIDVYLDYDPLKYPSISQYPKRDSIILNNYTFYFTGKRPSIKPSLLANNCFLEPGKEYSQLAENLTYSSFSSLSALSNTYIQHHELESDSNRINMAILTVPALKQSTSLSVEGTNTVGNLGVAASANYIHRNLFRGSETLNIRIRGAYESLSNFTDPYLEYGGDASISIPKLLFPFLNKNFLRQMRTSTRFSLSYNSQTRPEYDRTLLSGGISYSVQDRQTFAAQHKLDLLDIDYVFLPRTDDTFMNNLPKSAKLFGYTNQFIVGSSYSYNKSTFDPFQKQRSAYSLRFSLESAGNVLYAASNLFNLGKDSNGSFNLFGTHFAQFVKGDFDYAKTVSIDNHNSITFRIGGGIGIPYNNSQMLPFEKRYYSGGANSVRAWSVRELGPGSYVANDSTTFFHQSGDIKLDMNIEYRTHLFWKFEAAAFIDAGNIWTIKDYEDQEGGKFKFNSFYKQIAVGYGLGLRLDFGFFLVRFDCGWKAYDPAKQGKEAWAILRPNFRDNWAWHIAIGYPF
ncbi:outer membrane protein assembly factor [Bacteroidales bacterium OttesenSCG-928-I14]|nr:outer membrane protein assembly factor [Bacteroidales bacterium OttesenSCG-928-I14]